MPRVLIIEDEPLIALDLHSILETMGFTVCAVAQTRAGAVREARRHRPDLIVADVCLRGGDDGISTIEEIREQETVPVVFVTGNTHELRRRGHPDAIVVGKPFVPATLRNAVHTALQTSA